MTDPITTPPADKPVLEEVRIVDETPAEPEALAAAPVEELVAEPESTEAAPKSRKGLWIALAVLAVLTLCGLLTAGGLVARNAFSSLQEQIASIPTQAPVIVQEAPQGPQNSSFCYGLPASDSYDFHGEVGVLGGCRFAPQAKAVAEFNAVLPQSSTAPTIMLDNANIVSTNWSCGGWQYNGGNVPPFAAGQWCGGRIGWELTIVVQAINPGPFGVQITP